MPKPHPQNVAGPFYVEDGYCLICDVPRSMAPEMFKYTDDEQHCFVYRQPESPADWQKMIEVLQTQDIGCIRCRSRDRSVLKRLKNLGLQDACD
jgi:4Fe-4S single cluster domain of Ferredoxin I